VYANTTVIQKALDAKLYEERYWKLLLHMPSNESEIDDARFFFAPNGASDAKAELIATLEAFYDDSRLDDEAPLCKFPARRAWLKERLDLRDLPKVDCQEYESLKKRVDPVSVTMVFPSAHINSPASMFGHTFLRINSSYNSRLLSYAINYAADADPKKENGVLFAIKGLFGGYYGKYSLLPYYEKLKEYRDTENRDIWEYDLDLTSQEVERMFAHIWELKDTNSYYYFFTENCSYNMLWLLEIARQDLHLREYFGYQVIPLETVFPLQEEGIIIQEHYRPSKRSNLIWFEKVIASENLDIPHKLIDNSLDVESFLADDSLDVAQKRLVLEAAIELLEYSFKSNELSKEKHLELFHTLTTARATLGVSQMHNDILPHNPLLGHRAMRTTVAQGHRDGHGLTQLGFRFAYHDIQESHVGFLRGTGIEFGDLLVSRTSQKTYLEKATIVSIDSYTQNSPYVKGFSWRMKLGWDRQYLNDKTNFRLNVGAGYSVGNDLGYIYIMADPYLLHTNKPIAGLGGSFGVVIDSYKNINISSQYTQRYFSDSSRQDIFDLSAGYRVTSNIFCHLDYENIKQDENGYDLKRETLTAGINFYF
jgi:hypothetical protein